MTIRKNADPFRLLLPRRAVDMIGLELEGAWDRSISICRYARERYLCEDSDCEICAPNRAHPDDYRPRAGYVADAFYHMDGSVSFQRSHRMIGEIVSRPLRLREAAAWARQWWPCHVNKSCGLHVHMSYVFPTAFIAGLIADNGEWFDRVFRERMAIVGQRLELGQNFRDRLEGANSYCVPGIACNQSDRYRQVNLAAAWKHGTIECRLLPAIGDATKGIKAIVATVGTIDRMVRFLVGRERFAPVTTEETVETRLEIPEALEAQRQHRNEIRSAARAAARSATLAQAS